MACNSYYTIRPSIHSYIHRLDQFTFLSVCVVPEDRTHNLSTANAETLDCIHFCNLTVFLHETLYVMWTESHNRRSAECAIDVTVTTESSAVVDVTADCSVIFSEICCVWSPNMFSAFFNWPPFQFGHCTQPYTVEQMCWQWTWVCVYICRKQSVCYWTRILLRDWPSLQCPSLTAWYKLIWPYMQEMNFTLGDIHMHAIFVT